MDGRDYVRAQIECLPDSVIIKLHEFIAYQRFVQGLYDNDTDYLTAIPGMVESLRHNTAPR